MGRKRSDTVNHSAPIHDEAALTLAALMLVQALLRSHFTGRCSVVLREYGMAEYGSRAAVHYEGDPLLIVGDRLLLVVIVCAL